MLKNHIIKKENGLSYILCQIRKKYFRCFPEELVRQKVIQILVEKYQYQLHRISIEFTVHCHKRKKRSDLLAYNSNYEPYLLVECKSWGKKPNSQDFYQLFRYHAYIKSPFVLLTNGVENWIYHIKDKEPFPLNNIPHFI